MNIESLFIVIVPKLLGFGLLILSSSMLYIVLRLAKQTWVATLSHSLTLFLMPVVTYTITTVISGNIALSLGMVGALSIVRFRNPVRSPLELAVYFICITQGIAASVSLSWLIFFDFTIISTFALFAFSALVYFRLFGESLFKASFFEGNEHSSLTVTTNCKFTEFENSKLLKSYQFSSNEHTYIFAGNSLGLTKLKQLAEKHDNESILSIYLMK